MRLATMLMMAAAFALVSAEDVIPYATGAAAFEEQYGITMPEDVRLAVGDRIDATVEDPARLNAMFEESDIEFRVGEPVMVEIISPIDCDMTFAGLGLILKVEFNDEIELLTFRGEPEYFDTEMDCD